jgi:hypothetical protein
LKSGQLALLAAVLFVLPITARAQTFGGASLFEPEIDIVNSGAVFDAQATVSADRKYVTMTLRPQMSQLLALHTFTFQTNNPLPPGTVGGVNPVVPGPGGMPLVAPDPVNAPMRVGPGVGGAILLRRGVTPLILRP